MVRISSLIVALVLAGMPVAAQVPRGGGGGGEGGPPPDLSGLVQKSCAVSRSDSTTLSIGACSVRIGNANYSITPATVVISAGTGTAFVYVDQAGAMILGHNGLTVDSCTGCTAAGSITAFPATSIPIYTWPVTSGTWDTSGEVDKRVYVHRDLVVAGTGLSGSVSGGVTTLEVDQAVVATHAASTTVPGSCSATGQLYIDTDAGAGAKFNYCNGSTYESPAAGSGAPTDAQYLTLATNGTLSAERVLTPGPGLDATDAGAGSTYTIHSIPDERQMFYQEDFCGGRYSGNIESLAGDLGMSGAIATGGTITRITPGVDSAADHVGHPCFYSMATTTSANSSASVYHGPTTSGSQFFLVSNVNTKPFDMRWIIKLQSNLTEGSIILGTLPNTAANQVQLRTSHTVAGGTVNWYLYVCNNTPTCETVTTGVAPTTAKWIRARLYRLPGDTANRFRACIDSTCVQSAGTSYPDSTIRQYRPDINLVNNATGGTINTLYLDYYSFWIGELSRW